MKIPDFSRRSASPELIDGEALSFAEFQDCLQELETINRLTLAYRPTLRWLERLLRRAPAGHPLRIVDAGSGGGDMLRRVEELARRHGREVELWGVDLNPFSARSARRWAPASAIRYASTDVFAFQPRRPVDVVISSLFAHHLDDAALRRFLRWMDGRARLGWFVNDLHRHPLPYGFILAATRLCSRNRLIRHDAAVSVARAFRPADWRGLLEEAGIRGARISRHFPYRLCVSCEKC